MIRVAFCLLAIIAVSAAVPLPRAVLAGEPFDYLTLSLSWSPTWCASEDGRNDEQQCAGGRRYAFIVHGLWPQYAQGWPENCASDERYVPHRTIDAMLDIMPSKPLIIHQWRKHGTCSGLSRRRYFSAVRALRAMVQVPERYRTPDTLVTTTPQALEADFIAANDWLEPSMISVQCGRGGDRARLTGVRICFGRDYSPVACGANERPDCRADRITLPPVR